MGKARTLTDRELKVLMNHLQANLHLDSGLPRDRLKQAYRDYAIFQLLMCGLRIGEVAGLTQKQCVVVSDGEVKEFKIADKFCLKASKTKSKKGRWAYLTKSAKKALHDYLKCRFDGDYMYCFGEDFALLQSQKNPRECMSANSMRQIVNKHFKRCDIQSSSHFGRKQIASLLLEQGVSIHHISEILGHTGGTEVTWKYIENLKAEANLSKLIGDIKF